MNSGQSSVIESNSGKQNHPELEVKHEADQIQQKIFKQEPQSEWWDVNFDQTEVNLEQNSLPFSSSHHNVKVENEASSYSTEQIFIKKELESDYGDVNKTERNYEVSILPASCPIYNYPIKVENDAHDISQPSCSSVLKHEIEVDMENNDECILLHQKFNASKQQSKGIKEVKAEPHINEQECSTPHKKEYVTKNLNAIHTKSLQKLAEGTTRKLQGFIESKINSDAKRKHLHEFRICKNVADNNLDIVYICDHCNSNFISKDLLLQHIDEHFNKTNELSQSNNKLSKNKFIQNIAVTETSFILSNSSTTHSKIQPYAKPYHIFPSVDDKPYQCSVCKKGFSSKSHLNKHIIIHTDELPYQCSVCEKGFNRKDTLNVHLKIHTGEQPHQCSVCEKRFSLKSILNSHIRTHTGEKPYQCSFCEKRFSHKNILNSHIRIHTGEKPYQCSVCEKRFSLKNILNSHIRTHTGEKPYQCSFCEKRFSHKNILDSHVRIHTGEKPYQCSLCEKRFIEKSHLNRHIRIHTCEKPYQCSLCEKRFIEKSHLNRHIRIHTREKPYQCSLCDKKFIEKSHLNRHIKIHTVGTTLK